MSAAHVFPAIPPQVGFKKRRLQGSCDLCKRKKIKCDSAKMPDRCSNCIAFDSACTHNTAKRIPRSTQKPDFESSSANIQHMFSHFQPTRDLMISILTNPNPDSIVPNERKVIQQQLLDLAVYARHLEHEFQEKSAAFRNTLQNGDQRTPSPAVDNISLSHVDRSIPSTDPDLENDARDAAPFEELAGCFDKLTFDGGLDTADLQMVKSALNRQGSSMRSLEITTKRPQFWTKLHWYDVAPKHLPPLLFPPPDLLWSLIALYFDKMNVIAPLLHRPTFETLISAGYQHIDRWFGQSVLAVCAIGARYSEDPRVLERDASPDVAQFSAGHKYFSQVDLGQCVKRSFDETSVSVYELQTCCLVLSYLQGTSLIPTCAAVLGLALRLAHSVGSHQTCGKLSVHRELWRRCFWVLIYHDALMSAICKKPRTTYASDFGLEPVAEVDDEYWEHPDPTKAFQQPAQKPSKVTFFVHFVKLLDAIGFAQKTIYSVKQSHSQKNVQESLDRIIAALEKWKVEVPSFLQWDPKRQDSSFISQSACLSTTYFAVLVEILNPFIISLDRTELSTSSLYTSVHAARATVKILDIQTKHELLPLPLVQFYLFTSALVLLISLWDSQRSGVGADPALDMEFIQNCVEVLRRFERRWQAAGRLIDIITELINHDPGIRSHVPPSLKRPRPYDEESSEQLLFDSYTHPHYANTSSSSSSSVGVGLAYANNMPHLLPPISTTPGGNGDMDPSYFTSMIQSYFQASQNANAIAIANTTINTTTISATTTPTPPPPPPALDPHTFTSSPFVFQPTHPFPPNTQQTYETSHPSVFDFSFHFPYL